MSEAGKKIDAVFEGGGVKGSALIGAVAATEEAGYAYENIAGTSAGAIVGALVAAGYKASEARAIMNDLDYSLMKDPTLLSKVPVAGFGLSLLLRKGIYAGDYFERWIYSLLAKKNVFTFKDLIIKEYADDPKFRYKLQVIASDITNGKMLVLPRDARDYGLNPDDLGVAAAVRMSMSIPYFYTPVKQKKTDVSSYIVDGGILSNYPVWLLDDESANPEWPTIGYKLVDPSEGKPNKIFGPVTLFLALFGTMMEAHDARYIEDKDFARTVPIPTLGVQTTDFGIDLQMKDKLYQSGYDAAKKFFEKWSFEDYKAKFAAKKDSSRTVRLWNKQ